MARPALILLGAVVAACGLLFLLQGLGVVRWPASSFMIGARVWVMWGSAIAVVGCALILAGRRLR